MQFGMGWRESISVAHLIEATTPHQDPQAPVTARREPSPMYRAAMTGLPPGGGLGAAARPRAWRCCRESGPVLVVGNHDSHWDPVMVGIAAIRRRQIKALAKSALWEVRGLAPVLNGMGQIPIERDAGDAGALARAVEELRRWLLHRRLPGRDPLARQGAAGAQRRRPPRARGPRGEARLRRDRGHLGPDRLPPPPAAADPLLRAGRGAGPSPARTAGELAIRLLAEIRELVPPSISARKRS